MKKILFLIILLIFPFPVFALTYPDLYSKKVIVYDLTDDRELYSKDKDLKTNIASLTKIMTTITAIEKIDNMKSNVTITNKAFQGLPWDASLAGLKIGDIVTMEDLLYASILPSGADATQALAFSLSGGIDNFVKDMNALANKLGMKHTHFENVTGLDEKNHYSTASDILILLKYALANPTFKKIYSTKSYTLSNNLTVYSTINKYNQLMHLDTSRIIGSKTGFTDDAGLCISALFKSADHEMLLITLGAEYIYGNFYNLKDALKLIKFVDNNYAYQTLVAKNEVIKELPVNLSTINKYKIKANNNILKFLPNDYDKNLLKIEYNGKDTLNFFDKKSSQIGKVKYYYNNVLLMEDNIILEKNIDVSIIKIIDKYKYLIAGVAFILVCTFFFRKKRVS